MKYYHEPVLYSEVLECLAIRPKGVYVDGTLGGGGHALGICSALSWDGHFIGIDRDPEALTAASARLAHVTCRKDLVSGNYADIGAVLSSLNIEKADGILLDLGVSSFQLDTPSRGFSYMNDAPLDMRMDPTGSLTAEIVVNDYASGQIRNILKEYGEERWASRIAEFIAEARKEKRITTTFELVEIIKAAIPAKARREGPHPAKRTFQAIRIEVNDELGHLERALSDLTDVLASGGRLAVITFHSLEDRIVKEHINRRLNPCTCPPGLPVCACGKTTDIKKITGKPVTASAREIEDNPRARSAKLRVIEKR
ncbi:MAG TPA: 16S rRNA (cytosine(1402)-N(4))-methyltransferase RsmH [Anaerovoracaceae bacterium]|nr:16S rRNA (cytosine(1402)-N(4))-methyltransferase RsmH [Bacillota bacterium]HRV33841.1 16S rRNA (cytosine(1402)-N(4))-methyltransferase RsmH [Anaerovoracaceae bacterium]